MLLRLSRWIALSVCTKKSAAVLKTLKVLKLIKEVMGAIRPSPSSRLSQPRLKLSRYFSFDFVAARNGKPHEFTSSVWLDHDPLNVSYTTNAGVLLAAM